MVRRSEPAGKHKQAAVKGRIANHAANGGALAIARQAQRRARNILPIIAEIRRTGVTTLQGIGDALSARGVAAARGGKWSPTTVRRILKRV